MSVNIWNSNEVSLNYFDPEDLKNLNRTTLKQKLLKYFLRAYFFKSFFKLARRLDKSVNIKTITSIDGLVDLFFNKNNFIYASYVLMIKSLFKIYRLIITRWFDKNWFCETYETQEKWNYKMVNFISGIIISFIGIYLGKGSNIIFYTISYFLIKNLIQFDHYLVYYRLIPTLMRKYNHIQEFYRMHLLLDNSR